MRLILLDTNVVVSAGIKPGSAPHRILYDLVFEGLVQIVLSPAIAAEYREVCTRSKFAQFGFPPLWLEFLLDCALQLPDPEPWAISLPDPDDEIFLALAKASGAWLITGNERHFPPECRDGVQLCSPAQYLVRLNHP